MTGAAKGTALRLLVEIGTACADYSDAVLRDLPSKRIQCDEICSFVYAKQKDVPAKMALDRGVGEAWTWTAIDPDTRLIPSWLVGKRDAASAYDFMADLASRMRGRIQLTTDGRRTYLDAVHFAFGKQIDYAMLVKNYANVVNADRGYSPPAFVSAEKQVITGDPDLDHVSTSHVERANLTMRMSMRRFTRLTNGFSKKFSNLEAAVALNFAFYNFCRPHQSLGRRTPAQAAGVCPVPPDRGRFGQPARPLRASRRLVRWSPAQGVKRRFSLVNMTH